MKKQKEKEIKKVKKNERGITLIALVITVIVLLILAAVSIATLTGENGILIRANEAKEETEEAKEDELRRLTALEAATNTENTTHTDDSTGEEKTVTIPAGFAVSQVEGENTIANGLVIIDKNGNEFVWIPVNDYSNFKRIQGYEKGELQDIANYGEADENGINIHRDETSYTKEEAKNMYASVKKYKGFYIGRFETGIENNIEVIKKNVRPYTNIAWSTSGTETETNNNTGGAVEIARNFDELYGYKNTTTTLCYGVQWDSTIIYIDPSYSNYAKNSTGKGNYKADSIIKTGSNDNYKMNNIYDLAGNAIEWTMESYNISQKACRGSSYKNDGSQYPSSTRAPIVPRLINETLGFRISMYINI